MPKTVSSSAALIWRTTRARIATWLGFGAMCLGMFMAILDIQVVATSLPTIQQRCDIAGPDELDPDRVSDRRNHRHSADRLLTRTLTLRWLFVSPPSSSR